MAFRQLQNGGRVRHVADGHGQAVLLIEVQHFLEAFQLQSGMRQVGSSELAKWEKMPSTSTFLHLRRLPAGSAGCNSGLRCVPYRCRSSGGLSPLRPSRSATASICSRRSTEEAVRVRSCCRYCGTWSPQIPPSTRMGARHAQLAQEEYPPPAPPRRCSRQRTDQVLRNFRQARARRRWP